LLPVFGLTADDAMPGTQPQTVSTGTPQLMIPLKDHEALRRVRIDVDAYAALYESGDFFSPHTFTLGGATDAGATFARHVGALPGGAEDPFTGSATGGMAAYLWHYDLVDSPTFITVKVGGEAVTVVRGELDLTRVG
jgi:trans-2,3-dihydro-3-hydroxyanthranilate isomerase